MKNPEFYSGHDLEYPRRPSKPRLPQGALPDQVRTYADELEKYDQEHRSYLENAAEYRRLINQRKTELRKDLAEEYQLSLEKTNVLFAKAWEDGHSSGISEVIAYFDELVDLVENYKRA